MIVIASLIGVCYACLAFFQVKPFLFNKPTKSNKASK
jgi:hypothetical protein